MTMTVNSGAAAYCTGAQFVVIFDWRAFAQLASDTDVPLASSSALQSSAILADWLQIAAGDIEMAATVGARYDPADLAKLVVAPITNSGWSLISMNAALAAAGMFGRRLEGLPDFIVKKIEEADAKLMALEEGTGIFGFAETQQAGLTTEYRETPADVARRNLPSYIARRCFGTRANRLEPPD